MLLVIYKTLLMSDSDHSHGTVFLLRKFGTYNPIHIFYRSRETQSMICGVTRSQNSWHSNTTILLNTSTCILYSLSYYCQEISIEFNSLINRDFYLVSAGLFNYQKYIKFEWKCIWLNWPKVLIIISSIVIHYINVEFIWQCTLHV